MTMVKMMEGESIEPVILLRYPDEPVDDREIDENLSDLQKHFLDDHESVEIVLCRPLYVEIERLNEQKNVMTKIIQMQTDAQHYVRPNTAGVSRSNVHGRLLLDEQVVIHEQTVRELTILDESHLELQRVEIQVMVKHEMIPLYKAIRVLECHSTSHLSVFRCDETVRLLFS